MPTSSNQRLKLLYLSKIFTEQTDESHPLTIKQLIEELKKQNITAERKSLYSDIELLRQFGIEILQQRSKTVSYYLAERDFELPELKLLTDAVLSARFISKEKSRKLVKEIMTLTSTHQAKQLVRHITFDHHPKAENSSIYYTVDSIHNAINEGKQISFQYFDYDERGNAVYRKDGEAYIQTPVTLCWNDDNYYLITYSKKHDALVHYRVDRMAHVEICDENAETLDTEMFHIEEHIRRVFGMYNGTPIQATLAFDKSLINAVIDRFGKDIHMTDKGSRIEITAEISDSPVFLSWMFRFGAKAEILEPESLRQSMKEHIATVASLYQ